MQMNKRSRPYWEDLVDFAEAGSRKSEFKKFITAIRANFTFHYYQPKGLRAGYKNYRESGKKVYISRGESMAGSRFYFADAAVAGSMQILDEEKRQYTQEEYDRLAKAGNVALYDLVISFMEMRKAGWYSEPGD